MPGSLTVVGTGIGLASHITLETKSIIENAEKLLYIVADPATELWLQNANLGATSLYHLYDSAIPRLQSYFGMVDAILAEVRAGFSVCAVFYGHPGVFVFPGHEAVIRARHEGFTAVMKPAVSAEDCLFSDLAIDPGRVGCQTYEANDFLVHNRTYDPRSVLVIWQVGVIGQISFGVAPQLDGGVEILKKRLLETSSPKAVAIIYEASVFPVCEPRVIIKTLSTIDASDLSQISTLVVLPDRESDPDLVIMERLGIPSSYVTGRKSSQTKYSTMRVNL